MMPMNRREMLKAAGTGASLLVMPGLSLAADDKLFVLPKLPYAFDALEPHIDAKTMEIHHDRHHKAYVDNLNKAVAGTEWAGKKIEELLASLDKVPEKIRTAVRNNGGGHYNHSEFWLMMSPKSGKPGAALTAAINASFGDLDKMLDALKTAAMGRFGSGWGWIVTDKAGKLKILSSPNQDNTLMPIPELASNGMPILGIDVWEHAYYLKFQNKRADYIDSFFKVVNWDYVSSLYDAAKKA
jgi:superoxide dismutase, Fe-Mn family